MMSKEWDWSKLKDKFWREPAPEAYYLLARWGHKKGRRLLDLGCGVGRNALFFARNRFRVSAYDLSANGLKELGQTARQLGINVPLKRGDMHSLPYPNAYFDYLIAYHVIYHTDWAGLNRVMGEIRRVLKKHGEAYITFISQAGLKDNWRKYKALGQRTYLKKSISEKGVPHTLIDQKDLLRLLNGFQVQQIHHIDNIWSKYHSWHYHALVSK